MPRTLDLSSLAFLYVYSSSSPAFNRVEVIKGGGTQQAKDAVQQQLVGMGSSVSSVKRGGGCQGTGADDASSSLAPQGSATTSGAGTSKQNGNGNNSSSYIKDGEHKMAKSSLLRFYQQDREIGAGATAATAAAAVAAAARVGSQAPGGVMPAASPAAPPLAESGGTSSPTTVAAGGAGGSGCASGAAGMSHEAGRPHTCPVATTTVAGYFSVGGGSCSTTGKRRRRRGAGGRGRALAGEDVRRLLLRAMVGYDWVDEFNSKDVRVRGAFTEQDVVVLEVGWFVPRGLGPPGFLIGTPLCLPPPV